MANTDYLDLSQVASTSESSTLFKTWTRQINGEPEDEGDNDFQKIDTFAGNVGQNVEASFDTTSRNLTLQLKNTKGTLVGTAKTVNIPGGGSGGTTDYDQLQNRPQINSHTLTGNQSLSDLGISGQFGVSVVSSIIQGNVLVIDYSDPDYTTAMAAFNSNKVVLTKHTNTTGNVVWYIAGETYYDEEAGITYLIFYTLEGLPTVLDFYTDEEEVTHYNKLEMGSEILYLYLDDGTATWYADTTYDYLDTTTLQSKITVNPATTTADLTGLTIDGVSYKISLSTTATATLATASWSSKVQTVSVTGVTSTNTVIVSPAPSSVEAWANAKIYCSAQGAGTLTFTCIGAAPSVDVMANVVIMS